MEYQEPRHWPVLLPVAVIQGVISGTFHAFSVLFGPLSHEFAWNSAQTSSVFSVAMMVYLLSQIPGGRLADRYHPLLLLGAGCALFALGITGMAFAQSLGQVYLFYGVIAGTGLGGTWIPSIALLNRIYHQRRGWAMGIVVTANSICVAMMAPLARLLVDAFGWRTGYLVLGLGLSVATLASVVSLSYALRALADHNRAAVNYGSAQAEPTASWSFSQAWRSPQLWLLVIGSSGFGLGSSVLLVHLVPFAVHSGLPYLVASAALTFFGLSRVPSSLGLGWLADRVNRRILVAGCILLTAAMVLGLNVLGVRALLFPTALVFGISWSAGVMLLPPITGDLFGPAEMGSIYAVVNGGFTAGLVVGPVLAGFLFDLFDAYGPALLTTGGLLAVASVAILLIKPRPVPTGEV